MSIETPILSKLIPHGNSFAVVLDSAMLERLGIDASTPLKLSIDREGRLILTPVKDTGDKDFEEILAKINREHGKTLKRLAE